jgi:hypothetical protein
MRARPFVVSVAAALAAAFIVPALARAGAWLPAPGEYYSEFTAGRYAADTYYNDDGKRRSFPIGGMSEQRRLQLYNELGWKKRVSVVLSVPAISVTSRLGRAGGFASRTETGLADLTVGFRYRFMEGPAALALQVACDAPLGYQHVTEPMLGSGKQAFSGTLLYGAAVPRINGFVEMSAGDRFELNQGWTQVFGTATAAVWLGRSLLLSGRYSATFASQGSLVEGVSEFESNFEQYVRHVVNPQILYRVDERLDVVAGSYHTAAGRNVLHTDEFYVGLAFKQTGFNRLQGFLGGTKRP